MKELESFESISASKVFLAFTKGEDEVIFEDVYFKARAGEIAYITGRSGSGKSLMLKIVSGLFESEILHDRKFTATIEWGDHVISEEGRSSKNASTIDIMRAKNFGIIFQDFRLVDNLSGKENILFPLYIMRKSGLDQKQENQRIMEAESGLSGTIGHNPTSAEEGAPALRGPETASGPLRGALIHNPFVILGDEPTSALDPEASKISL